MGRDRNEALVAVKLANPNDRAMVESLRSSGALAKIEKKYLVALTPEGLIDCGKDACAWIYGDYAFKLTTSAADAQACIALLRLRRTGMPAEIKNGLAKIFEVCDLNAGMWIIVSEFLPKPTPEEVSALRQFSGSQRDLALASKSDIVRLLDEKILPNAKADLATRYGVGRIPDETVDRAYAAWRSIALLVRDYNISVYKDAHAGNFGRDAAGNIKLFDFGESSFPGRAETPADCNWSCDPVAQNPRKPRRKSVYSAGSMLEALNMEAFLGKTVPKDTWKWGLWPKDRDPPKVGDHVWWHDPKTEEVHPVTIWKITYGGGMHLFWFAPFGERAVTTGGRRIMPKPGEGMGRAKRGFAWMRELSPMDPLQVENLAFKKADEHLQRPLISPKKADSKMVTFAKPGAWPIDELLPEIGDRVKVKLGGGAVETVTIWDIRPSRMRKGELLYYFRRLGDPDPKPGELEEAVYISSLVPLTTSQKRDEAVRSGHIRDRLANERKGVSERKPPNWPSEEPLPVVGQRVWFDEGPDGSHPGFFEPVVVWNIIETPTGPHKGQPMYQIRGVGSSLPHSSQGIPDFAWLESLKPMAHSEAVRQVERSIEKRGKRKLAGRGKAKAVKEGWPVGVPAPQVGDRVRVVFGKQGAYKLAAIYKIEVTRVGVRAGELEFYIRNLGAAEPKMGELEEWARIDELRPLERDEEVAAAGRSGINRDKRQKEAREESAKRKEGWPKSQPPPLEGDLVWWAPRGGHMPPIGVEILQVVRGGGGPTGLPDMFEWREIKDSGAGGGQAFLNELRPPNRMEEDQFLRDKLAVKARQEKKKKAEQEKFPHGARTKEWFKAMDDKAAFHGGPSHADWIRILAEKGWIHKVENFAKIKIGKMYKCGAFGCAFAIKSPPKMAKTYIIKITADQDEGPAQAYIGEGQRKKNFVVKKNKVPIAVGEWFREGYTILESIMTMGETLRFGLGGARQFGMMDRKVFAIIREDIDPEWERSPRYYPNRDRIDMLLSNHRSLAQQYNRGKVQGNARLMKEAKREMLLYISMMEKVIPSVAHGLMAYFLATGTAMQDVHGGNVGLRKHAEFGTPGDMVIFDPGMSASAKADAAAKKHIKTVLNNPHDSRYPNPLGVMV